MVAVWLVAVTRRGSAKVRLVKIRCGAPRATRRYGLAAPANPKILARGKRAKSVSSSKSSSGAQGFAPSLIHERRVAICSTVSGGAVPTSYARGIRPPSQGVTPLSLWIR